MTRLFIAAVLGLVLGAAGGIVYAALYFPTHRSQEAFMDGMGTIIFALYGSIIGAGVGLVVGLVLAGRGKR